MSFEKFSVTMKRLGKYAPLGLAYPQPGFGRHAGTLNVEADMVAKDGSGDRIFLDIFVPYKGIVEDEELPADTKYIVGVVEYKGGNLENDPSGKYAYVTAEPKSKILKALLRSYKLKYCERGRCK